MEIIKSIVHWLSYAYYLYVFGYASLFKVFQKQSMMQSMDSLGFNKTWTLGIGIGELFGVILLLIGLYKPEFKNIGILLLFPFAVGALTAHMAHQEYHHFYNSLIMCVLSIVLLATDKHFKITV
ncbi:DoxX family protein [Sphingobacterium sp. BIGb0165]|uniref:DoxX family protein n=1 Tax=Sphingobacterium sp. BIGb0165 TaxID=2940615 RepID=UPI002168B54B|nr:DoxX family protein [Sphingobacterium sp. BIGb0165]MCS4226132.1 putative membrane protein YphA (DoxX/SURF4 family) [Sphingobacterium sp. BIGb0165]